MAAGGAYARKGNIDLPIESELLRDHFVLFTARTEECVVSDGLFWFRRVIITPSVASGKGFFFCEWKHIDRNALIVGKSTDVDGKKFTPLAGVLHVRDDAAPEHLIVFPCILFIKDAIPLLFQTNATKTILAAKAFVTILTIHHVYLGNDTEFAIVAVIPNARALIHEFALVAPGVIIHGIFHAEGKLRAVTAVLEVFGIETVEGIF